MKTPLIILLIFGAVFFEYLISYSVQFAKISGFTNFENVCVDGTVIQSANNKFNVVHKEDVEILIDYYSGKLVDYEQLESLRFPARKIINRTDKSNKEKLKYLNDIMKRFDETGANTIPVHDMESIHIYNKQRNPDVGYNLQTAADSSSKNVHEPHCIPESNRSLPTSRHNEQIH